MKEPNTPAEWQTCVDAAAVGQVIESSRAYGLITGGPEFNAERCADIIARGKAKGILPSADPGQMAAAFVISFNAKKGKA